MAYSLGPVPPFVQQVADRVGPMLDVPNIGGWRATAHDMSGHPAGLALDFMVGDDRAKGQRVADYFQANASTYQIKYLIWQQKLWRPGGTWTQMDHRPGTAPGYDPNHLRHVHVSFLETVKDGRNLGGAIPNPKDAKADDGRSWTDSLNPLAPAQRAVTVLTDRGTWVRVFQVIGGTVAIGAGVAILLRDQAGAVAKTVAGIAPHGKAAKVATSAARAVEATTKGTST